MRLDSLHTLYVERLRDVRDAEDQVLKALPRMVERVQHVELRNALERHLAETHQQVARLEQIFDELDESPRGKTCKGMAGVIDEAEELARERGDASVLDAGIIDAAQHVEHYEIASYGTLCTFAELLGYTQHLSMLEATLNEEKRADEVLTALAERSVNLDALHGNDREVMREVELGDRPYVGRDKPIERRPFFGDEETRY
ncbi:MAG TPA: ferritin-like domain-containing protein [Gemmatimonadaceae bacterium]|nr:ferritin-like domain-containing protein [Gemmatimonadaceae bacterium]